MDSLVCSPPLNKNEFYIIDGGFSTQLGHYVQGVDEDPLWTARSVVNNPSAVERVHADFIRAGARIILTASYQISEEGFKKYMELDSTATGEAVVQSVSLARSAIRLCNKVDGDVLVGGSVGPLGACKHDGSEYTGTYLDSLTNEELVRWHVPRIKSLVSANVDFIAAETLPCWREALAILDCVVLTGGYAPVWVSFTMKDGERLAGGELLQEAVRRIRRHELFTKGRIFAMGVNCCDPKLVTSALDNVRGVTSTLPLIVYPNSGEVWNGTTRRWEGTGVDCWEQYIKSWIDRGVIGIGGCCTVNAKQLASIRMAAAKSMVS